MVWLVILILVAGERKRNSRLNLFDDDCVSNHRFAMIYFRIQNLPECSKKITEDFVELSNAGLKLGADML